MVRPFVLGAGMAAVAFALGFSNSGWVPGLVSAAVAFVVVWGGATLLQRNRKPPEA